MANTLSSGNQAYSNITYTGKSGQLLTTTGFNGTNGASWAHPSNQITSSNGSAVMTIPANGDKVIIEEKATLEVKGNVKINGIDLEERLSTIEKVLMIPQRDATMEAKYPSLKKKYDEYIKELSKYRMWESIKGNEND